MFSGFAVFFVYIPVGSSDGKNIFSSFTVTNPFLNKKSVWNNCEPRKSTYDSKIFFLPETIPPPVHEKVFPIT